VRGARVKWLTLAVCLLGAGLGFLAWSQSWFVLRVTGLSSGEGDVVVPGSQAGAALAALSLAALAAVGALAIAGVAMRIVLGLLTMVLGGCMVLAASIGLADPVTAAFALLSKALGVSGADEVRAAVLSVSPSPWPVLAIVAGVVVAAGGLLVLLTAGRWPRSGSRYAAVRFSADARGRRGDRGEDGEPDRVVDWDALSNGQDPTDTASR